MGFLGVLTTTSVFLVFAVAERASEVPPKKPANMDMLGIGYDALLGNPYTDGANPGFKDRVLRLQYSTGETSADGQWIFPDHVNGMQLDSCNANSQVTVINSTKAYSELLSGDAKVSGGFKIFSFRASAEWKKVHEGTSKNNYAYVISSANCNVYKANIQRASSIPMSTEFSTAVRRLPTDDYGAYLWMIDVYGTHYISEVVMGAKFVLSSEFEQAKLSSKDSTWVDAAARVSFTPFFDAKGSTTVDRKKAEDFEKLRSNFYTASIGSRLEGNLTAWQLAAKEQPYPIGYKASQITELLSKDNFPDVPEALLTQRRNMFDDTIMKYYGHCQKDCRIPAAKKPPVVFDLVGKENSFSGTRHVSCKDGFSVLSCSVLKSPVVQPQPAQPDPDRYAVPLNATTCECKDSAGGQCVARCSNAVDGFQLATDDQVMLGGRVAKCPGDTKVVSCHSKAAGKLSSAPNEDGSACTCSDGHDSTGSTGRQVRSTNGVRQCVASCASSLTDYQIVTSAVGKGNVTVSCPAETPDSRLLGCGARWTNTATRSVTTTASRSVLPSMDVQNNTFCTCFDEEDVTCYAICGKFGDDDDAWKEWRTRSSASVVTSSLCAGRLAALVAGITFLIQLLVLHG